MRYGDRGGGALATRVRRLSGAGPARLEKVALGRVLGLSDQSGKASRNGSWTP
jgi:hypothetical protein